MIDELEREAIEQMPKVAQKYIEDNGIGVKVIPEIRLVQFFCEGRKSTIHFNQLHKTDIVMKRLYTVGA